MFSGEWSEQITSIVLFSILLQETELSFLVLSGGSNLYLVSKLISFSSDKIKLLILTSHVIFLPSFLAFLFYSQILL